MFSGSGVSSDWYCCSFRDIASNVVEAPLGQGLAMFVHKARPLFFLQTLLTCQSAAQQSVDSCSRIVYPFADGR